MDLLLPLVLHLQVKNLQDFCCHEAQYLIHMYPYHHPPSRHHERHRHLNRGPSLIHVNPSPIRLLLHLYTP